MAWHDAPVQETCPEAHLDAQALKDALRNVKLRHPGIRFSHLEEIMNDCRPRMGDNLPKCASTLFNKSTFKPVDVPCGNFFYISNWGSGLKESLESLISVRDVPEKVFLAVNIDEVEVFHQSAVLNKSPYPITIKCIEYLSKIITAGIFHPPKSKKEKKSRKIDNTKFVLLGLC